jgi:hypothetical protein
MRKGKSDEYECRLLSKYGDDKLKKRMEEENM